MVVVKKVGAKCILDSRREKTIYVSIKTAIGVWGASSPNGKSKGKYEATPYKKSIEEDIKTIKKFEDYFSSEMIEKFDDLRRIEDILDRHVGANTIFAMESAVLKAMAHEQKKEIWELIIQDRKKIRFPHLVGNCIGGGLHNSSMKEEDKRPDFQEFLLIPKSTSPKESSEENKKSKKEIEIELKKIDEKFEGGKNDEDAWITSLSDREAIEIVKKTNSLIGVDMASSGIYKRKKYRYKNPPIERTPEEQTEYASNIINNLGVYYIEDPFEENDFESFSKLLKKFPDRLIVGDDLTTTNSKRLKEAISMKSINAIIIKPNQCGSLIEVKEVCKIAKENKIKIIFSHRSGETNESIISDLAFGFQADFLKCGITGKEREAKIKRLVEIEKSFTKWK